MKSYRIGLDFGTSQSKVCVYDLDNDNYEFFKFPSGSYFLPSRVSIQNNRFIYGTNLNDAEIEHYAYFKMATANDDEMRKETFSNGSPNDDIYGFCEFSKYSPETLSILYITNILFLIKEKYKDKQQAGKNRKGLLGLLLNRPEVEDIKFTTRLGIPTEWSHSRNIRRKRKFESVLLISECLQAKYSTHETFLNQACATILSDINELKEALVFPNSEAYHAELDRLGISVYPETAAGLAFIFKNRQLRPGYYATMDIGGGSTDVSYFYVLGYDKIRYLASESYIMAANNVFQSYRYDNSIRNVQKTEQDILRKIEAKQWHKDEKLVAALKEVDKKMDKLVKKLYNKRVYFFNHNMVKNYSDQPIILYGGGARLPIINEGKVEIHDNGTNSFTATRTFLEKQDLERYSAQINISEKDSSWKKDFTLLVVALGLSFVHAPDAAEWFELSEYQPKDGGFAGKMEPHPVNEGFYISRFLNNGVFD